MKIKAFALIISFIIAVFLFSTQVFAVTGDAIVTNKGQSVPNATVVIESAEGKTIAKSTTDDNGRAKLDLPEELFGKLMKFTVTPPPVEYGVTADPIYIQIESEPEPWTRLSLDLDGGMSIFDKYVASVIEKAAEPINVGENSAVGTGARVKQKVMEQAGGMLGGALGGLTGGMFSGGGGDDSETEEPELAKDPVSDNFKRTFTDPATGTKIRVGGQMTPKGLHISTTILDSPDKGTFQTVYLMDDKGNKTGPILYEIYDLYLEWMLTVFYKEYSRSARGEEIVHNEWSWSTSGRDMLGTFVVPKENDGIWKQMGFPNAVAGIKGLGTLFPINPDVLQNQRMHLVVHVTRPSLQAVNTTGYVMSIPPMSGGGLNILRAY